jgi:hypothetical protein
VDVVPGLGCGAAVVDEARRLIACAGREGRAREEESCEARLVARRRFEKPLRLRVVSVVSVASTAPGFASFLPRAQRAQAAK